jgi:hypothetical protein
VHETLAICQRAYIKPFRKVSDVFVMERSGYMSSFFDESFSVGDFVLGEGVQSQSTTAAAIPLHGDFTSHPNRDAFAAFLQSRARPMPIMPLHQQSHYQAILPPTIVSNPIMPVQSDTASQGVPSQSAGTKRKGRPPGSKNKPKETKPKETPSSGTKKDGGRVKCRQRRRWVML